MSLKYRSEAPSASPHTFPPARRFMESDLRRTLGGSLPSQRIKPGDDAMLVLDDMLRWRDRGFPLDQRTHERIGRSCGLPARRVKRALAKLYRSRLVLWQGGNLGHQLIRLPHGRGERTEVKLTYVFVREVNCRKLPLEIVPRGVDRPERIYLVPGDAVQQLEDFTRWGGKRRGAGRRKKNQGGPYPPSSTNSRRSTNKASQDVAFAVAFASPSEKREQGASPSRMPPGGYCKGKGKAPMPTTSQRPVGTRPPAPPPTPAPPPAPPPGGPASAPTGHGGARAGGPGASAPTPPPPAPWSALRARERLAAAGAPDREDLMTARVAITPRAPLLPTDLPDFALAQRVMAGYRAAMSGLCPKGRGALLGANLRRWSGYSQLVDAGRMLQHHGISPAAWAAWRQRWWASKNGPDAPIPVKIAFNLEAISSQHAWWEDSCAGGRTVYGPAWRSLCARWAAMEQDVCFSPDLVAAKAAVARHFPPGAWDVALDDVDAEARAEQRCLRLAASRGEWLPQWGTR